MSAAEATPDIMAQPSRAAAPAMIRIISPSRPDDTANYPGASALHLYLGRLHPNDRHHASILMVEDVAVINKITDDCPAEVHPHLDIRIFPSAIPVRHLENVVPLLLFFRDRFPVHFHHLEMDLVHVEFMHLEGTVLDGPVFHRAFGGNDRGRIVRIEQLRCLSINGNKEIHRLASRSLLLPVTGNFQEEKYPLGRYLRVLDILESLTIWRA